MRHRRHLLWGVMKVMTGSEHTFGSMMNLNIPPCRPCRCFIKLIKKSPPSVADAEPVICLLIPCFIFRMSAARRAFCKYAKSVFDAGALVLHPWVRFTKLTMNCFNDVNH